MVFIPSANITSPPTHCALHALIPNNKSSTYLPCVVSASSHLCNASPSTGSTQALQTQRIRLDCVHCHHIWLSYLSPANNRIFRYHLFEFSHCRCSLKEAFNAFSLSLPSPSWQWCVWCSRWEVVLPGMFGLHGDAVWVEKRDSDRAVDRGIMRNAREGSELRAGQTPYTWLFTAVTLAPFSLNIFLCVF